MGSSPTSSIRRNLNLNRNPRISGLDFRAHASMDDVQTTTLIPSSAMDARLFEINAKSLETQRLPSIFKTVWPSGLRRQTQVLVERSAWVRTPQLSL